MRAQPGRFVRHRAGYSGRKVATAPATPGAKSLGRTQRFAARLASRTVHVIAGTDRAVREAGLTKAGGRILKRKLATAALRPRSAGDPIIRAAASEIERLRREPSGGHFRRIS